VTAPYEAFFENEYVRLVSVTLERGQEVPSYAPAASRMVRIDLNDRGRTDYVEGPLPEVAGRASAKAMHGIRVELKSAPQSHLHELGCDPSRAQALSGRVRK
jgi:hypothetical protein